MTLSTRQWPTSNSCFAISASLSNVRRLAVPPPEFILSTMNLLDFQCMTVVGAVSWCASALVHSLPKHSALTERPDALHALFSTKIAIDSLAPDIYETLQDILYATLFFRGQFGPILDMFTAQRYYFNCVTCTNILPPVATRSARKQFGIYSRKMYATTDLSLLSIPWKYTESKNAHRLLNSIHMPSASTLKSHQHEFKSQHLISALPAGLSQQLYYSNQI